ASRLNDLGLRTRRGKHWTKNTVLYTLRNEIYTGTYIWNKKKSRPQGRNPAEEVRVANAVPPLISRAMFDAVQAQIRARSPAMSHPRTTASHYLLAGLLRCGPCDRVMQGGTAKSGEYHYYACYTRLTKGAKRCTSKFLRQEFIEDAVLRRI